MKCEVKADRLGTLWPDGGVYWTEKIEIRTRALPNKEEDPTEGT